MDLLFGDGLARPACLSYHLSPTTVPSLLHRPKLPFPPSCLQSADKTQVPPLTTTKAKRGVRHRNSSFIVHRRNSPVCWLKVQHTEYRIKKRGNREREGKKPLEVQSCKQKMVKDFLTQEAFLQIPCKTGSWCALKEPL